MTPTPPSDPRHRLLAATAALTRHLFPSDVSGLFHFGCLALPTGQVWIVAVLPDVQKTMVLGLPTAADAALRARLADLRIATPNGVAGSFSEHVLHPTFLSAHARLEEAWDRIALEAALLDPDPDAALDALLAAWAVDTPYSPEA